MGEETGCMGEPWERTELNSCRQSAASRTSRKKVPILHYFPFSCYHGAMNRRTLAFTALLFLLPLVGCWKEPIQPLPLGQQTVSGLIKPASISVIRRGTHVLIQGGEEIAYLESATVDLGEFEGRTVDVSGTYEANTDPDALPVIVVAAGK